MANNNSNNNASASWGGTPTGAEEHGPQIRLMGLKVHYTFDKDNQERCLARWPHILRVQTIPLDERNTIGIVDLRTCLHAVAQCSPELAGDSDNDYTVYAFDYSEPDTPLVGQGMFSWGLGQNYDASGAPPKMLTGRVTQNILAVFGNGIKDTLEVRLKLTAVPKPAQTTASRNTPAPHLNTTAEPRPSLARSASVLSENTEWNTFVQCHPGLGHTRPGPPAVSAPTAAPPASAPAGPLPPQYETRHDYPRPSSQGPPSAIASRQASVESNAMEQQHGLLNTHTPPAIPTQQSFTAEELPTSQPVAQPSKPQSRPTSRASTRAPTGRPRGRPRKKPLAIEGSTSGYEDGTDGDDGPPRSKKRAKTTKVERSNTATFGSAPDSLRVAASTAGSIRNFRPIAAVGDTPAGSHLQEVPRAPTPVPESRFSGMPQARPIASSGLRRESISSQGPNGSFNSSYFELGRSMPQSQNALSPVDSAAPSPTRTYSDGPSPADIGSSPPVPRSALYSVRSSPVPSSPILPPMPKPASQPDSGFMSGGFEDSRLDSESINKAPIPGKTKTKAPAVSKPKPRRTRAKKPAPPPKVQRDLRVPSEADLRIQTETPGPPELLPQSSLYNPPRLVRQNSKSGETARTPIVTNAPNVTPTAEPPADAALPQEAMSQSLGTEPSEPQQAEKVVSPALVKGPQAEKTIPPAPVEEQEAEKVVSPEPIEDQQPEKVVSPEAEPTQQDIVSLEASFMSELADDQHQQYLDSLGLGDHSFTPAEEGFPQDEILQPVVESNKPRLEAPVVPKLEQAVSVESELPMVPASDPVLPQLTLPVTFSEPATHPMTDFADAFDGKSNKNYVKRQQIKQKLEEAVAKGQLPSFCRNCGALQTPTWRKIWKQEHQGIPAYHEYSERPGHVTAINVLERDDEGKPLSYEIIKKSLGPKDDKSKWNEVILCNPCGIWFSKWKAHRPSEKWEADEKRLSQTRRKRGNGGATSRAKKARTKSDAQMNPTSEACLPTDPIGPLESSMSPKEPPVGLFTYEQQADNVSNKGSGKGRKRVAPEVTFVGSTHSRASTHSRGTGTPESPIALDDELGDTRRLLFPSPRKDDEQKVLGEVAVNLVQTSPAFIAAKVREHGIEKENGGPVNQGHIPVDDDLADLFGTPPRPSTPPPKGASGPFKTPTRATPSHRPVTRSVTKSMRSGRTITSPSQLLERTPSRTPSRTPRSSAARHHLLPSHLLDDHTFETPLTRSINQLLSEADEFVMPSPHRHFQLDLSSLPHLDSDDHLMGGGHFDFGNLLSTDAVMPSSPPILRNGQTISFGGSLSYEESTVDLWAQLNATGHGGIGGIEDAGRDAQ